jgi:hypothetical protein
VSKDEDIFADEFLVEDIHLCEAILRRFRPAEIGVRARVRRLEQNYHFSKQDEEIVRLQTLKGVRSHFHLQPYVLERPLDLLRVHTPSGAPYFKLGRVVGAQQETTLPQEVGRVETWYYPIDHLVVIWEAYFYFQFRASHPFDDPSTSALWDGVEQFMLSRFPDTAQIVAPFLDPGSEFIDSEYQAFLRSRGYHLVTGAAFGKKVRGD